MFNIISSLLASIAAAITPAQSNVDITPSVSFTGDGGTVGLLASLLPPGAFSHVGFDYSGARDKPGYMYTVAKKDLQALLDLIIKDGNNMSMAHIHHILPGAKFELVDGKLVVDEIAMTSQTEGGRLNARDMCKLLNRLNDFEKNSGRHQIGTKIDLAAPCSEEVLAAGQGKSAATTSADKKRKRKEKDEVTHPPPAVSIVTNPPTPPLFVTCI